MNRILVTGSAGFIGFHTVMKLIKEGIDVLGIDDINDHYDPLIKHKRLNYLNKNFKNNFEFKKHDIRRQDQIKLLLKKEKFKAIINLAARAGVRNSLINPKIYYETNTGGVLNILNALKEYQTETTFLQASSSSIYGDNEVPFKEEDKVDHPMSPYAATKKASEEICYTYHYLYKINTLIFRFFTVYGTYGRPDMSYFKFIKCIDESKELILYGDGTQERDFTFVEDIVEALLKGINFKGYEIINLGNDNPIKINTIIQEIENNLGKKAIIKNLPLHPADIFRTCAKIERAKKILNWQPVTNIEQGLKIVVDWYKKEKKWLKKVKTD